MKKLLSTAAVAALLLSGCSTPKLAGLATKKDLTSKAKYDFNRSKIRESGRGFSVDMKALGKMPKRIALVSFYIDDPGITKISGTNSTGKSYNTTNTGSAGAHEFANEFSKTAIENLKGTFKKYDIDLLTPTEFLTDDDKKQFYNDFIVKNNKIHNVGEKIGSFFKDAGNAGTTLEVDEAADGFKLIKINNRETADPKKKAVATQNLNGSINSQMIESVGYDLCKNLDVDAVLIVYNTQLADIKWSKTRNYLSAVNMQLLGPNPLPLKEEKKDNFLYSKGLFYCGVRMRFPKGLLINPKISKKATDTEIQQLEKAKIEGYNNVVAGLGNRMGTYLQQELNKK